MAAELVLGLYADVNLVAASVAQLRQLGVADEQVTVMSGTPYAHRVLGRPRPRHGVGRAALLGAILGVVSGLLLALGTFLLYPLAQGGQPLVPIPPSLIVIFEIAMLGTMWTTFFAFLVSNRLPVFGRPAYDPRITLGEIGLLAEVDSPLSEQVAEAMQKGGAREVKRLANGRRVHRGDWFLLVGISLGALVVGGVLSLLFFYDVLRIPFPSQMVDQESIGYGQGPRLAAPAAAVPIEGPVLIAGQPASAPLPATAESLQRGQVLFATNCTVCHGQGGSGDGPLSGYFSPRPADLSAPRVQDMPPGDLFLVLTLGRGLMPSLAENLDVVQRWDVINHVRSLRK